MRKIIASILALTLTASMFTACGDSDSSSKSESSKAATTTTAATTEAPEESEAPAETEAPEEPEEPEEPAATENEGPVSEEDFDKSIIPGYDESATETVLEPEDQISDAWASSFADGDFIDARTLERDKDLHMVVEFAYTDKYNEMIDKEITDQHKTQIVIGPARANGWQKFALTDEFEDAVGKDNFICDYPWYIDYEGEDGEWVQCNGEDLCTPESKQNDKSVQVWPDVFVKGDGFIKIGSHDVTSIEYTIPAATVNSLIDNAFTPAADEDDTEHGWDGILFQLGGNMYITKITMDQGNVFMFSDVEAVYNPETEE